MPGHVAAFSAPTAAAQLYQITVFGMGIVERVFQRGQFAKALKNII